MFSGLKRCVWLGSLALGCGVVVAEPSPVPDADALFSTSIPLQVRRSIATLEFRFVPAENGTGATVRVAQDPGAVAHVLGVGTGVVTEAEGHLLVSKLQADGFFKRATLSAGGPADTALTGGVIELSGFDDAGRALREVVEDKAVWLNRVSGLAAVLGTSSTPACCDACRGLIAIMSIGSCERCGGTTRSGAFPVCTSCALEAGRCERCQRVLPVRAAGLLKRLGTPAGE